MRALRICKAFDSVRLDSDIIVTLSDAYALERLRAETRVCFVHSNDRMCALCSTNYFHALAQASNAGMHTSMIYLLVFLLIIWAGNQNNREFNGSNTSFYVYSKIISLGLPLPNGEGMCIFRIHGGWSKACEQSRTAESLENLQHDFIRTVCRP